MFWRIGEHYIHICVCMHACIYMYIYFEIERPNHKIQYWQHLLQYRSNTSIVNPIIGDCNLLVKTYVKASKVCHHFEWMPRSKNSDFFESVTLISITPIIKKAKKIMNTPIMYCPFALLLEHLRLVFNEAFNILKWIYKLS